jgi:hypothetical protein
LGSHAADRAALPIVEAAMEQGSTRKSVVVVELGTEERPELIRWSTTLAPEGRYSPFESYALHTAGGWVLVDPEEPSVEGLARLRRLVGARPVATVLTSDGHERDCYRVRERWGTPVWAPAARGGGAARPYALEGHPDHAYGEGTALPGGLRPVAVEGLWEADCFLLWLAPGGQRVLFTGDALNGQVETALARADHYRREPGLAFGSRPGYFERHPDQEGLKRSLRRVAQEIDFDLICGAHGRPYPGPAGGEAKVALRRLLDSV